MSVTSQSEMDDLAASCIRCGFCLEACPTFRLTGAETESPRGRIYLARSAAAGEISWADAFPSLDTCLGCRACETACPSAVKYGEILELAREQTVKSTEAKNARRIVNMLTSPHRAWLAFKLAKIVFGKVIPANFSQFVSGKHVPITVPEPQLQNSFPPLDLTSLPRVRGRVVVISGCINRILFPRVNEATVRLLRRVGFVTEEIDLGCCGALHAHAGFREEAIRRAKQLHVRANGNPIIVNSAGCGSWLKETLEGVYDVSEFLLANDLQEHLNKCQLQVNVAYHDACHLSHGQKIVSAPRHLLRAIKGLSLLEIEDGDQCCGSAGIYNLLHPELANSILMKKVNAISETDADFVACGNPGCYTWIQNGLNRIHTKIEVRHTAEILESACCNIPP